MKLSPNDAYRWNCPGCSTCNDITFKVCCGCGSHNRPSIGIETMSAAGFEWDPSATGYARWTHKTLGTTALRSPWMLTSDWEDHMAAKIDEANQLSKKPGKPFLREIKQNPGFYEIVRNRGTAEEFFDLQENTWNGMRSLIFLGKVET